MLIVKQEYITCLLCQCQLESAGASHLRRWSTWPVRALFPLPRLFAPCQRSGGSGDDDGYDDKGDDDDNGDGDDDDDGDGDDGRPCHAGEA